MNIHRRVHIVSACYAGAESLRNITYLLLKFLTVKMDPLEVLELSQRKINKNNTLIIFTPSCLSTCKISRPAKWNWGALLTHVALLQF
jgi:hypothetical protein